MSTSKFLDQPPQASLNDSDSEDFDTTRSSYFPEESIEYQHYELELEGQQLEEFAKKNAHLLSYDPVNNVYYYTQEIDVPEELGTIRRRS
jgi:hypothetical protein